MAIAQTKLELLLNQENLNEENINQVTQAQNALRRLSRLSASLGTLTKIDNKEFDVTEDVDLSVVLKGIADEFKELISLKNLTLQLSIMDSVVIKSDPTLIEMLLSNLINNAIRHNLESGFIEIELSNQFFSIKNSGPDLEVQPMELFERFKKSNQSDQSTGLGLAIVKQICELNGFKIGYTQSDQKHEIQIEF